MILFVNVFHQSLTQFLYFLNSGDKDYPFSKWNSEPVEEDYAYDHGGDKDNPFSEWYPEAEEEDYAYDHDSVEDNTYNDR